MLSGCTRDEQGRATCSARAGQDRIKWPQGSETIARTTCATRVFEVDSPGARAPRECNCDRAAAPVEARSRFALGWVGRILVAKDSMTHTVPCLPRTSELCLRASAARDT
jgi:hypothetical protein